MVPEGAGFQPVDGTWNSNPLKRREHQQDIAWSIDEDRFRVVRKTAEWAREQGTALFVVVPPRLEPSPQKIQLETEYLAKLTALGEELKFRVFDLREPEDLTREAFSDSGHLNRIGAEELTRRLAERIRD